MRHGLFVFLIAATVFSPVVKLMAEEKAIVKKVYNGNTIKLLDGTKLKYIGVDAPDKKDLPFYRICKEANKKLVSKKEVTVKTNVLKKDNTGTVPGYVYVGDLFINAELIRLGYALACDVASNEKYKDRFFSMQEEARKKKRGIWAFEDISAESYYVGSKINKEFHRPECFHAKHLKFEDRVILRTKEEALSKGFRQDWRCCPLFKQPEEKKK